MADKPCRFCGVERGSAKFQPGNNVCLPCQSARSVEWAKKNRERKRASNNAYHARISGKRAERTRQYRESYPEKRAAHQAVQTALRNGTLVRQPCEVCGTVKVHAHHDDYERPLSVRWLCHTHHMEHHAMLRETPND